MIKSLTAGAIFALGFGLFAPAIAQNDLLAEVERVAQTNCVPSLLEGGEDLVAEGLIAVPLPPQPQGIQHPWRALYAVNGRRDLTVGWRPVDDGDMQCVILTSFGNGASWLDLAETLATDLSLEHETISMPDPSDGQSRYSPSPQGTPITLMAGVRDRPAPSFMAFTAVSPPAVGSTVIENFVGLFHEECELPIRLTLRPFFPGGMRIEERSDDDFPQTAVFATSQTHPAPLWMVLDEARRDWCAVTYQGPDSAAIQAEMLLRFAQYFQPSVDTRNFDVLYTSYDRFGFGVTHDDATQTVTVTAFMLPQ